MKTQIEKLSKPIIEKVAIVGAGLGGLATAIALRKQGFDIHVYEKAQEFRPAGAGLTIAPNGLNCLAVIEQSIVEDLKRSGCDVRQGIFKKMTGETIAINPIRSRYLEKYGQPFLTIWWWRLQQILASKLPPEIIHLNHRCVGFEQNDNGVEIYFENGKKVYADLLVGADGLNSVVREKLIGDGKPHYVGSMIWRAVIKYNYELLKPDEIISIKGNKQIMRLLNVGDGYIFWAIRKLSSDFSVSDSATLAKSRVLNEVAEWEESLRGLVDATEAEQILEGPICDRPPLAHWSKGRVTLLGDAAHPMATSIGQGASTTFEDAYELAQCFSQSSSIEEALSSYEKRRIDRTQIIQTRSALADMRSYETDSETFSRQTQEQSQTPTGEEFLDWLYNYKPFMTA
ncbi:FAD-dependent oxidoreductase [Scytonema sp. HK-05]|uniref:FAD-dependent oxidoreductase n=1 Tax=Scytonema sp. HK-05 TaxID=1137095 RepID=UPI000937AAFE|nr:FAD-dependent monooxygenase [Scytonema sp. HK-05]OKH57283.1 FAD-binding monooxygenase [Scytonema sp. HK-05]